MIDDFDEDEQSTAPADDEEERCRVLATIYGRHELAGKTTLATLFCIDGTPIVSCWKETDDERWYLPMLLELFASLPVAVLTKQ